LTKPPVIKRLKAFLIDYLVILIYIGLLIGSTLLIAKYLSVSLANVDPVSGELIGFVTLTLPVILYFTLMENSKYAATLGKGKVGLKVVSKDLSKATLGRLLTRNCIKFLPWELAHFFVFRLFDFTRRDIPLPGWVLVGLITSQAIALIYTLFLFSKNGRSVYELLSSTRVIARRAS
jgi:uncharacterized RDD family membrane protein YckC